jgi:hypothetical protein
MSRNEWEERKRADNVVEYCVVEIYDVTEGATLELLPRLPPQSLHQTILRPLCHLNTLPLYEAIACLTVMVSV